MEAPWSSSNTRRTFHGPSLNASCLIVAQHDAPECLAASAFEESADDEQESSTPSSEAEGEPHHGDAECQMADVISESDDGVAGRSGSVLISPEMDSTGDNVESVAVGGDSEHDDTSELDEEIVWFHKSAEVKTAAESKEITGNPALNPPHSVPLSTPDQQRIAALEQERHELEIIATTRREILALKNELRELDNQAAAAVHASVLKRGDPSKPVPKPRPASSFLPNLSSTPIPAVPPHNPYAPVIPAIMVPSTVGYSYTLPVQSALRSLLTSAGPHAPLGHIPVVRAPMAAASNVSSSVFAAPLPSPSAARVVTLNAAPPVVPPALGGNTFSTAPLLVQPLAAAARPPPAVLGVPPSQPAHSIRSTPAFPYQASAPAVPAPASTNELDPLLRVLVTPVAEMCEVASFASSPNMELVVEGLAYMSRRYDLSIIAPILRQGGWNGSTFSPHISSAEAKKIGQDLRDLPQSLRVTLKPK